MAIFQFISFHFSLKRITDSFDMSTSWSCMLLKDFVFGTTFCKSQNSIASMLLLNIFFSKAGIMTCPKMLKILKHKDGAGIYFPFVIRVFETGYCMIRLDTRTSSASSIDKQKLFSPY